MRVDLGARGRLDPKVGQRRRLDQRRRLRPVHIEIVDEDEARARSPRRLRRNSSSPAAMPRARARRRRESRSPARLARRRRPRRAPNSRRARRSGETMPPAGSFFGAFALGDAARAAARARCSRAEAHNRDLCAHRRSSSDTADNLTKRLWRICMIAHRRERIHGSLPSSCASWSMRTHGWRSR